ncbi:chromosomal replication initiator protein DnaA [Patescibacteria group bacterium]|nr:chromosomal replication initiator protein DnaA [Patescibacteria group bacterium]MBU2036090.1 chromosomal replication initiator protein DnaA [Patescibacteria group bacterium]
MDELNKNQIWKDSLESIKISVSSAIFSTWFSQTHISELKKENKKFIIQIGCNSPFVKTTLENRYYGLIQDALSKVLEMPCDLMFIVKENPNKEKMSSQETISPLFENNKDNKEEINNSFRYSRIKPGFTFENFAVSSSNQMAWAAAEAVSKNPGSAYNPLFVWGGVGVGKTHLMNAIGVSILQKNPDAKIHFCTGEEFTNDIVEGIRTKTTQAFRNKYRKLKVLFVDDIQFIAGKDAVQEEFFHTFNAVQGAGGQVILTSDKPPDEISKLEERLRSRFEAGLIVDIAPPDFELRCAITQIKAKEKELDIPMEIVQLIAGNVEAARKIEGFLTRLMTESNLKKVEISEDFVQSLLGKGVEPNSRILKTNPNDLINAVAEFYSLGKRQLLGDSRARPVSLPRQVLMYLLRTQYNLPLQEVGRLIGGRDHTTVMHAVDKITNLASTDVKIREDILGIKNNL